MLGIRLAQRLYKRKLRRATDSSLEQYAALNNTSRQIQQQVKTLSSIGALPIVLSKVGNELEVGIPIEEVFSHSLILGASGAGKSYCALAIVNQILKVSSQRSDFAFGLLDAKGELFNKVVLYLNAYLFSLSPTQRDRLRARIRILDFSNNSQVAPYNILCRNPLITDELLIANRIETISEQFWGLAELSVRMRTILKYMLLLMVEFNLPLPFFEQLCRPDLLSSLVEKSQNERVRNYFAYRFERESTSTLLALRQRIDALLLSEAVRLSLSAPSAPDFAALQDEGFVVLINTAGSDITRGVSELLQGLVLSDIKQSVFQRKNDTQKFLWFFDEAQNLYKTSANREHMVDLLTMARSYRSFFCLITQSLTSAVRDADILNSLMANVRWILLLRSTTRDGELLSPALPLTGRVTKPRTGPFEPFKYMTMQEELKAKLKGITKLRDRDAYLWLKAHFDAALRVRTVLVPPAHEIAGCSKEELDQFMRTGTIGGGLDRETILSHIANIRSEVGLGEPARRQTRNSVTNSSSSNVVKALEESYVK